MCDVTLIWRFLPPLRDLSPLFQVSKIKVIIFFMRTSYSSLSTYQTCPLRYKYQEIDKIKGKKSKEQIFGTIVHKALNYMFTRSPLFPTLDEVLDSFSKNWDAGKDALDITDAEKNFFLENGRNIIKKFFLKNQPWNFNILDLESRFEVLLEDPETKEIHVLAGIIDRIDKLGEGSYEIIDYKTSRRMPSQDILDKNLQLSIYHLGLIKRWPHISPGEVKLSLYFLEHGEKISTKRNADALEATKGELLNTIREIKEKEKSALFPPLAGSWCAWCPYRKICPMWRHLYEKEKAPNDIEIKKIVSEYFSFKEEIDERNDVVKALQAKIHQYLDEKDLERLFGDEGYITRRALEKPVYDLDAVRNILEPIGKWQDALKVDEKKLEKTIKALSTADRNSILKNIIEMKKTVSLAISRKKVSDAGEDAETQGA